MIRNTLLTLIAALGVHTSGFAGEDLVPVETVPIPNMDFSSDFSINGWIVQLAVGIENQAQGVGKSVFLGFDDIISNLDWIVPLGADFRYKRIGFLPDLQALKLSGAGTTPGPLFDRASVEMKMAVLNLIGYYRVVDKPDFSFDVLGGARYLWVDLDVNLSGGPLGSTLGSAQAGTEAKVWNGVVGGRVQQNLNDKLFYTIYGDVGTGDSELTWQVQADLGYRFTETFSLRAGYRYLHYDNLEDTGEPAQVDVTGSGPMITLNWTF